MQHSLGLGSLLLMIALGALGCDESEDEGPLELGPEAAVSVREDVTVGPEDAASDPADAGRRPEAGPLVEDAGNEDDAGLMRDASSDVPSDAGGRDAAAPDSGAMSGACPDPLSIDCSQPHADCQGGCAINCLAVIPVAGVLDCTRLASCVVSRSGPGQELALCEGSGWYDDCDDSFVARCEDEIAIGCARGRVTLAACASSSHCWAAGSQGGCSSQPGTCTPLGNGCEWGAEGPCCGDLVCSGGTCRQPEGGVCEVGRHCALGLACRDSSGLPPPFGSTGLCVVPECVAPRVDDFNQGEACSELPAGLPCCGGTAMTCDPLDRDRCCFASGVVPMVGNSHSPASCCSGQTDPSSFDQACL